MASASFTMSSQMFSQNDLMVRIRLRRMRKDEVRDLYDAALSVAQGSPVRGLPETAQGVVEYIRSVYPQWI